MVASKTETTMSCTTAENCKTEDVQKDAIVRLRDNDPATVSLVKER
jgi:hypothetical protein